MERSALKGRRIALGVGGGIAAYKACELVRELSRSGASVRVAMTEGARQFVTPLTFASLSGHPVLTDYFDPSQEAAFGHIELAKWAELFVIAPATADLLARIRAGMGNDPVTTTLLAYRGRVLLAPAMNVAMFENAITQSNLHALAADSRFRTVGPGAGLLACGDVGQGRLSDVPEIADAAARLLGEGPLSGQRVLVSAGPTREYLDPVRFLSNPSTGKMGLAIAEAARARGADVTVVLGPVTEPWSAPLDVVRVEGADEMAKEVLSRVEGVDYFVSAAAVSDWKPRERLSQKQKKTDVDQSLELVRTPDILAEASRRVAASPKRPILVGFAAETEKVIEHARQKLQRKALDFIVANDVTEKGSGFGTDTNRVTVLGKDGLERELKGSKHEVAGLIWDLLARPGSPPP